MSAAPAALARPETTSGRRPWAVYLYWVAILAMAVGTVILTILNATYFELPDAQDDAFSLHAVAGISILYAWVGGLILARRRNAIGLLCCLTGAGLALWGLARAYAIHGHPAIDEEPHANLDRSGRGGLTPAAAVPDGLTVPAPVDVLGEELPSMGEGMTALPVRHQGELLGAITLTMSAADPMTSGKERLVSDLASQAGLLLRNVRLIADLRASRRRIVATQDERAKALERNIHDGAQQQLVALTVKLRLAEQLAERDPAGAKAVLADLQADATDALETLRDLARGIYPPLLADKGLPAALEAQARKASIPVAIDCRGIGRYPPDVEAAVYFCCLEALQNVAKYAGATRAVLEIGEDRGRLTFRVADDGRGFDTHALGDGTGLRGMADRMEAVGGRLDIQSDPGRGTVVTGRIPVASTHALLV